MSYVHMSRKRQNFKYVKGLKNSCYAKSPVPPPMMVCPLDIGHYILFSLQTDFEIYPDNVHLVKSECKMLDFKIFNCKSNNKLFLRCVN